MTAARRRCRSRRPPRRVCVNLAPRPISVKVSLRATRDPRHRPTPRTPRGHNTRDADFGYVTSFLAKGEPGDAYGKAPHWPRFEPGSMKRAFINNATHIGDYVSEACDLWREVDATKLQGLLYRTLNLTLPGA